MINVGGWMRTRSRQTPSTTVVCSSRQLRSTCTKQRDTLPAENDFLNYFIKVFELKFKLASLEAFS